MCLFHFWGPFKKKIAPTSPSWMSKVFRDYESLGKSNGNKWSQIWKLLLIKGVKLLRKKNCFQTNFALMSRIVMVLVFLTPPNGLVPPHPEVQRAKFSDFWNPLGKSNRKKRYQIWKLLLLKGVKSPSRKKLFTDFFPGSSQLETHVAKRCCRGFLEVYRVSQIWKFLLINGVKSLR